MFELKQYISYEKEIIDRIIKDFDNDCMTTVIIKKIINEIKRLLFITYLDQ